MVATYPGPAGLGDVAENVHAGRRLTHEDGVRLFTCPDLLFVGRLANEANRARNHDRVSFVHTRYINYSNLCATQCVFCAFARHAADEPGAYTLSVPEIVERAGQGYDGQVAELHITGGLHPDMPFSYYTEMLAALRTAYPKAHLKAFTAVEIGYFAQQFGRTYEQVLRELHEAGLDSLPGGGAEIFAWEVRRKLCPGKLNAEEWLEVHRTAHRLGMKTTATMLYGHIERPEHRVDHMLRLRALQDETGGFTTFIPLAFQPENNFLRDRTETMGVDDLRTIAVSRLLLDNFPHVKAYWIMLTEQVAQIATSFGASDLHGTVVEEQIAHDAGARTAQGLTRANLVHLIRAAGKLPVERDTFYNVIHEY